MVHTGSIVLEFRVVEKAGGVEAAWDAAMARMRNQVYAEKHRGDGRPVHLLAVAGGQEERNIPEIRAETA